MRGNVVDLAVGFILGGAFGQIVSSLVNDVLMPPIGLLLGKVDFSNLFVSLSGKQFDTLELAKQAGAPIIKYGLFLNTIINFTIVAFAMFIMVKQINRLKRPAPALEPTTKDCPFCCSSIPLKATRCPQCTAELPQA